MGTDAQGSGALICRCSWKPLFHCQAQLLSNRAPRPWQRGFPSSPEHTEGWEARREGPKAAAPAVSPFLSLPGAATTESEGRKDRKSLDCTSPFSCLSFTCSSANVRPPPLSGCALSHCHPVPCPGGKTQQSLLQGAARLQRMLPHFSPPPQQNLAPIPPPHAFLGTVTMPALPVTRSEVRGFGFKGRKSR